MAINCLEQKISYQNTVVGRE